MNFNILPWVALCTLACRPVSAWAWGDEGHAIIALIAQHYLQPSVRIQVDALLAGDRSGLTADTSMAREAAWADRYRDADRGSTQAHYLQTRQWHYVDIELDHPDVQQACFGMQALAAGTPASQGPPGDCIVDKIQQFAAELQDAHTPVDERRLALQFLLHLVGDVHQPLHAADAHDQGGNLQHVQAAGLQPQNLHRYWDVEFVQALGSDPQSVAATLVNQINDADARGWQSGSVSAGAATTWALESFEVGRQVAYSGLGQDCSAQLCQLSSSQVRDAAAAVMIQLERAGVRLALVLNQALH